MKTDISVSIGARIRHFRELAGLSQLQLSEKVQCEPSTLAHYETGKNLVSMTKLIRISEVLKVELYQFFIPELKSADVHTSERLNKLISTAGKSQLELIYNIISGILEFNAIKK